MATTNGPSKFVPEQLFHTVLTVIDASGANHTLFVLKTHGTLDAAKKYASHALEAVNFTAEDFGVYRIRADEDSTKPWTHGDGVLVFARSFDGQEFLVGIDTTPNNESLTATSDGEIKLPEGAKFLHYLLQITVDYNADRSGSSQTTEIEGTYIHRADAWTAAHVSLDPTEYAEFDRRGDAQFIEEWPFGEDVAVHAVSETGQNYFIAVKRPPEQKHEVKPHSLKK
ncbi:hypothetical protein GGI35DRAFT_10004 [Trichoderma velutinum]